MQSTYFIFQIDAKSSKIAHVQAD